MIRDIAGCLRFLTMAATNKCMARRSKSHARGNARGQHCPPLIAILPNIHRGDRIA